MYVLSYTDIIDGEFKESFSAFKDLLLEYNNKFNLTAITDEKGIYIKHFLDSVAGESFFPHGAYVAEIGSGGGFPSVPLKIVRGDLKMVLVESTGKKCEYLNTVVDKLRLNCVKVENMRAEDAAKKPFYREKFDVAVARAVARLNTLAEYCMPFVKVGGRFIAYKGAAEEEIAEAKRAVQILGGELERVEKYALPDGENRSLIIIKKGGAYSAEVSPRAGKGKKKPDCLTMETAKTCAFTGHRNIEEEINLDFFAECLQGFIDDGYDTFLSGMARGFDLIAADMVLKMKEKNPHVKLIACVPCPGQSKYFPDGEKKKYDRILPLCDEVITVSGHYYNGCMQKRDRYMVDRCSLLIAYNRAREGGTYYTLNYAVSCNKKVCVI